MRWLTFLLFFTVFTSIVGGVHYYIYRRLVVSTALPAPYSTAGRVALIVLAASIPLSFVVARGLDRAVARYLVFPVYVWLGCMLLFFMMLLSLDILHGLAWLSARLAGQQEQLSSPERRLFLARVIAGTTTGTVLTAVGCGLAHGLGKLLVKPIEVELPHLPPGLDGFRIAQLTDLHLGPMRDGEWLAEVVAKTNAEKPDLVAITGDLADGTVAQLAGDVAPLKDLKAPHGVFFVTGNHEYFVDLAGWLGHLPKLGIRVLHNERVSIEKNGAAFDLAGVDDQEGRRLAEGHGPDVGRALKDRDPARAVVLLAHQPRTVYEAAPHGVGLLLCGHTHGGQIWPWKYFVYLQQPYISGLHRYEDTLVYVSDGTGFWGPPIRLGSTAEITLITLRAPPQKG